MWLTPCELFTPYYSNVLANFAAATMQSYTSNSSNTANGRNDGLFEIVEIGGGRGTNAKALLNHLNKHHPNMYDRLHRYTIFDTSTTLHELQREVLLAGSEINSDEPILHADKIKLVNLDMMDVAEGK